MSKLETSAELMKIGQLLGIKNSTELAFLEQLPLSELIKLRTLTTDKLFNDGRKLFQKLTSASNLIPLVITASIGEKVFGAMLCARIASEMPYQRAIDLSQKMSVPFLAKVTLELDPRRVKDIIQNMPLDKMRAVAKELLAQKNFMIMGGFVGFMKPDNLKTILNDVADEEALLHIGFFIEEKHIVSNIMRMLPKERLRKLITYMRHHKDLWPESLALMVHIEDDLKREMGDIAAAEHEVVLDDLIQTVHRLSLWQDALPLFACMSPNTQYKVINVPSMQQHDVLQATVLHTAQYDLWSTLLPLIEYMTPTQRQILAQVVAEQEVNLLNHIITVAYQQHLWQPLFDLLAAMSDAAQQQTAPILHKLLATEGQLQQKWQPLIEARQLGHLFV